MLHYAGILLISIFLAINMGASGFSISFAPSYGSNILKRQYAIVLYTIFVLLGAYLIGGRVVETLSHKLIKNFSSPLSGFIILFTSTITMFIANILKIPQSTSFVTVGSFTGAGLFFDQYSFNKLGEIFFVAIIFSLLAFIVTYLIMKQFYPISYKNYKIYSYITNSNKLKKFIVITDCYSSFAVGTNNVANVVAPLIVTGANLKPSILLLLIAPLFGIGGILFGKGVINTISKDIVPLGEISAGIVSLVTSSFVIISSLLGLPTPYVQFTTFSVFAISVVKDGFLRTSKKNVVKRILIIWILIPIIAMMISYVLHYLLIK